MIDGLLDQLSELGASWLLVLSFLLPLGETIALLDFIVPGEVGMILIGAAANEANVSLAAIITIGALGAFVGDSVSWYIGHRWGTALIDRWEPLAKRLRPPLAVAEGHFARRGGPSIFAGRFIGALRAIVPLVAGAAGMPYRRFVPWNAAASIAWVSVIVTLGSLFGDRVAPFVDRNGWLITAAALTAVVAWLGHRTWRRSRKTNTHEPAEPDGNTEPLAVKAERVGSEAHE